MLAVASFIFYIPSAMGACPNDVVIQDMLTCSNFIQGVIDHDTPSELGGDCDFEDCYSCGEPYTHESQSAAEAVYDFLCQANGVAKIDISEMPCDLDIYVLNATCDPYGGCLTGSTAVFEGGDSIVFQCNAGQRYYVVVEAHGLSNLELAYGVCTDDGTVSGFPFSPSFGLQVDLAASTACAEDCDDGIDNDLDLLSDCSDTDCWADPICCDLDLDGYFASDCGGDDCDDANASVYPDAPEDGGDEGGEGDGLDNDCDGVVDNGTFDVDDDGDGFNEYEGDCNDDDASIYPEAVDLMDNGIDENCDGVDSIASDNELSNKEGEDLVCGCVVTQRSHFSAGSLMIWVLLGVVFRRRRL